MTKKEEQELKRQAKLEKERARIETMRFMRRNMNLMAGFAALMRWGEVPFAVRWLPVQ